MLDRVGNRRRAAHKLRVAAVVAADPLQPPHDVRQVRPEHAAVGMHLIHNDVSQVREELRPPRVVRQDGLVQHVRVGEDDLSVVPQLPPLRRRRVAVVRAGQELDPGRAGVPPALESRQPPQLVLRQGLRRVDEQRCRERIGEHGLDHWDVVAQRLAAGRTGHDDNAAPGADVLDGLHLVDVQPLDAGASQCLRNRLCERLRQLTEAGWSLRQFDDLHDLVAVVPGVAVVLEEGFGVHSVSVFLRLRRSAAAATASPRTRGGGVSLEGPDTIRPAVSCASSGSTDVGGIRSARRAG